MLLNLPTNTGLVEEVACALTLVLKNQINPSWVCYDNPHTQKLNTFIFYLQCILMHKRYQHSVGSLYSCCSEFFFYRPLIGFTNFIKYPCFNCWALCMQYDTAAWFWLTLMPPSKCPPIFSHPVAIWTAYWLTAAMKSGQSYSFKSLLHTGNVGGPPWSIQSMGKLSRAFQLGPRL